MLEAKIEKLDEDIKKAKSDKDEVNVYFYDFMKFGID